MKELLLYITIIVVLSLMKYYFKLDNVTFMLLLLAFTILYDSFLDDVGFVNTSLIKKMNNNIINKFNNNQKNLIQWTDDHIIPLHKYNKKDCTNDGSCIIPADNINLFPTQKNAPKLITRQNIEYKHPNHENNFCMICLKNIDPLKNPITENFTDYDPYGHFDNKVNTTDMHSTVKKILTNKENNISNSNISIKNIKDLSNKICHHCKVGLCINDGCISV